MIIVGVANVDRYRDLSPVGRRGNPSGIEPFSRFFVEELIPYVEKEYRTKDYRVLMGPQAGAAFGLYTLAERQGLFGAFIIENPFRSPPAVVPSQTPDEHDGVLRDSRGAFLSRSRAPSPPETKALAMPAEQGFGFDDEQGVAPGLAPRSEGDEQCAVMGIQLRTLDGAVQCDELLAQQGVLGQQLFGRASQVREVAESDAAAGSRARPQPLGETSCNRPDGTLQPGTNSPKHGAELCVTTSCNSVYASASCAKSRGILPVPWYGLFRLAVTRAEQTMTRQEIAVVAWQCSVGMQALLAGAGSLLG